MKMNLVILVLLMLVTSFSVGLARKTQQKSTSCGFAVQGESVEPTIKGPVELVPLVYLVEQPDSPVEIVSVDLTGMRLSISDGEVSEHFCAKYRVRNRSDQTIQEFGISLMSSTISAGGTSGTFSSSPLSPGQAVDVQSCGGGFNGSAKKNYVRLLIYVDKVDFEGCHYNPSLRIPRSLGVLRPLRNIP
jgi:hypothetical protein